MLITLLQWFNSITTYQIYMPLVLMAAQRFPNPFVQVRVLGGMPVLGYMQQRLNRHVGSIPTPRFMRRSLNGRATASQPSKKVSCYFYTTVVQWIEYKPAKFMVQVRSLAVVPSYGRCSVSVSTRVCETLRAGSNPVIYPRYYRHSRS